MTNCDQLFVQTVGERERKLGRGVSHLETTPSFSISVGCGSIGDQYAMCGGLFNIWTALTSMVGSAEEGEDRREELRGRGERRVGQREYEWGEGGGGAFTLKPHHHFLSLLGVVPSATSQPCVGDSLICGPRSLPW